MGLTAALFINSWAPVKFEWNFRYVIFKRILVIDAWSISCEIALLWMSLDFNDDQSTLFQVMAWCRQASSHYLSQCWPRSLPPYSATRPQWVKFSLRGTPVFLKVSAGSIKSHSYWQVSQQLSCSVTCQIWMRYKTGKECLGNPKIIGKNNEQTKLVL